MNRVELLRVLKAVRPALSNQDFLPMLANFCFLKGKVFAFDDIIAIEAKCPDGLSLDVAVPGNQLFSILSSYSSKTIEIEVDDDSVLIKAGRGRARLVSMSKDAFIFKKPRKMTQVFLITKAFLNGISNSLFAVGDNPLFPHQMGITMVQTKQGVNLYSTDNITMAMAEVDLEIDSSFPPIQLPSSFCRQLFDLEGGAFKVDGGAKCAEAVGDDLYVYTKVPFIANLGKMETAVNYGLRGADFTTAVFTPPKLLPSCERATFLMKDDAGRTVSLLVDDGKITIDFVSISGEVHEKLLVKGVKKREKGMEIHVDAIIKACKNLDAEVSFSDNAMIFSLPGFTYFIGMKEKER